MIHTKTQFGKLNGRKSECTGCTACMNICPRQAVSMLRNQEGFWEPYVDKGKCTECGLCERICHLKSKKQVKINSEPTFFAAISKDMDNVSNSSSGGVFYELCKAVLNQSGIIYGAVQMSVYEVVHQRETTLKGAKRFRRSKYLESNLSTCYKEIEQDLKSGEKVLFSGVGCQIAGLCSYLQKDYENLYTCEVVCHGIPSFLAYEKYLTERGRECGTAVCGINFRDKSRGWKKNSICEYFEDGTEAIKDSNTHLLHSLYLKGINMRTVCGDCIYARTPRTADITLADFWQYKGRLADVGHDKGISLIAVNNSKGRQLLGEIKETVYLEKADKNNVLESCRHMSSSPFLHRSQPVFMKMIQNTDFQFAARLCAGFGEVVEESELHKISNPTLQDILSIFWEDERETIYVPDKDGKLRGIITCGAFMQNCMEKEFWINDSYQKVLFSEHCAEEIEEIFKKYTRIRRIPVMSQEGFLLFEVRREGECSISCLKRMLGSIEPFLQLYCRGIEVYFVKRPDWLLDYHYTDAENERIERGFSFPKLSEDIEKNESFFRAVFKEKFSPEYVRKLRKIPQIIEVNGRYRHADYISEYINVTGGCRKTCGQPKEYRRLIHVYGRCGVFGYAVEDMDTMPSVLQRLFNQEGQKIRVVNHGLWGADNEKILHNLSADIAEGIIEPDDQVILYMDYLPCMNQIRNLHVHICDSTYSFHQFMKRKTVFYDRPGHMTAEGYQFMAEYIYKYIKRPAKPKTDHIAKQDLHMFLSYAEQVKNVEETEQDGSYIDGLEQYLSAVEKEIYIKGGFDSNMPLDRKTGAIVMNCNPFTKGHRYLIETSAKEVELLLVFVVEEDRSYFPFQERFRMVKEGTKDLKNVRVLSGGRFMISALTFPEYFIKEQAQEAEINPVMDVKIFAEQIAPRLNISVRFAGTEPWDKVTDQYNDMLRDILPNYGIEFREIERFEHKGRVVTATEVRKLLEQGKTERIKELVPESTYDCLKEQGYLKENIKDEII